VSTQGPDIRWTKGRLGATALHAVVGFLLGVLLTAVLMLLGGMVVYGAGAGPPGIPRTTIAVAGTGLAAWWLMRHGAFHSCRKHPAGPLGIAIGVLAGGGVVVFSLFIGRTPAALAAVALVAVAAEVYGSYTGGRKGLSHRYALKATQGVGIVCAHCGYDLSATPANWPCPECGGTWRYKAREEE
jgi:hypothetical protein